MPVTAFIRSLSQRFTRARNRQPHQQQSEEKTSAASGATTFDGGPRVKSRSPIPHNKVNGGGGVEQMTGSVTTSVSSYSAAGVVNGGGSLSLNHQQPQSAAKFSAAPKSSSSRSTTISGHRPEPALSAAAAADHTKFVCKVQMLDNTVMNVVLSVFESLQLEERDYFGLQFTDQYHIKQWLDPLKRISKQLLPDEPPYVFSFHVKFYSSEPNNLLEEFTRYQFFLQLKNDILTGKLECNREMIIELAALSLQSELGDYSTDYDEAFISEFRFHPQQDEAMEMAIFDHYRQKCAGLSPEQSERAYLNRAKWLDFYGVDMHIVEGRDGNQYSLGLTPSGMLVFDGRQKIGLFFWEKIQRLDFKNKKITLVVEEDDLAPGQIQLHTFVFNLSCARASKHLWKCAIEYHMFFRLRVNKPPKQRSTAIQFFRLGSTFKYRGRTEYETVHREDLNSSTADSDKRTRQNNRNRAHFERRSSQRYAPRESHIQRRRQQQKQRHSVIVALDDTGHGQVIVPPAAEDKRQQQPAASTAAAVISSKTDGLPGTSSSYSSPKNTSQPKQQPTTTAERRSSTSRPNNSTTLLSSSSPLSPRETHISAQQPLPNNSRSNRKPSISRIPSLIPSSSAVSSTSSPNNSKSMTLPTHHNARGGEVLSNNGSRTSNHEGTFLTLQQQRGGGGMVGSPPPPSSGIPRPFVTTIKIKEFGIANGIDVAPPPTTNLLTARPQGNGGPVNNGAVSRNSRSQRMSNGGGSNYATATTSFGMMMPSNGSSDSVDSASALTSATTKLPVYNGTKKQIPPPTPLLPVAHNGTNRASASGTKKHGKTTTFSSAADSDDVLPPPTTTTKFMRSNGAGGRPTVSTSSIPQPSKSNVGTMSSSQQSSNGNVTATNENGNGYFQKRQSKSTSRIPMMTMMGGTKTVTLT